MRHVIKNSSSASSSSSSPPSSPPITLTREVNLWKSPIPYLFGGLALMLALISMSLLILACSYTKRSSSSSSSSSSSQPSSSSSEEEEDLKLQAIMEKRLENYEFEPKILVIMAGDHKPTYLANPIVPLTYCTCQSQSQSSSSSSSNSTSTNHQNTP